MRSRPALGDGVEVLPGDGERHDLRLAAAGRHLDGVASEVVVLEDVDAGHGRESLDEIAVPTDALDLVEIDERLDGLALRVVVPERRRRRACGGQLRTSGSGAVLVVSVAPLYLRSRHSRHRLADGRYADRRRDPCLEKTRLVGTG